MRKINFIYYICCLAITLAACEKDTDATNFAPTVTTGNATDIYRKGATLSGSIKLTGTSTAESYGILFSKLKSMAESTEYPISTGETTYEIDVQGLEPGTTYYYCSYAHSGFSTSRGEIKNFTTTENNAPVFDVLNIDSITPDRIFITANLLDDGDSELILNGICWKEGNSEVATFIDNVVNVSEVQNDRFSVVITGLKPETDYTLAAYSVNSHGMGFSESVVVKTGETEIPVLSQITPKDSTDFSITISAKVLASGFAEIERVGFVWSNVNKEPVLDGNNTDFDYRDLYSQLEAEEFSTTLENLEASTTYYIRAYAMNEAGTGYSDVISFTTEVAEVAYFGTGTVMNGEFKQLANGNDMTCWDTDSLISKIELITECKVFPDEYVEISRVNAPIYASFNKADSLLTIFTTAKKMEAVDGGHLFRGFKSLRYIDFGGFSINQTTTNLSGMFAECPLLTSLNVSNWDTSNVTDMSYLFAYTSLTSLDVSKWDTSNVTNLHGMFGCIKVTTLDVSKWDTSSVTDMTYMFGGCTSLTSLDVSNWNTSKVTTMHDMFCLCTSLTTLDVSNWDTSSVTDMDYMFEVCSSLILLDISNWNTSNVTTMKGLVVNCSSLSSFDASKWDVSNVTNMEDMFENCNDLEKLNISNWELKDDVILTNMFGLCSSESKACEITATTATKNFLLNNTETTLMNTDYFTWKNDE